MDLPFCCTTALMNKAEGIGYLVAMRPLQDRSNLHASVSYTWVRNMTTRP